MLKAGVGEVSGEGEGVAKSSQLARKQAGNCRSERVCEDWSGKYRQAESGCVCVCVCYR